MSPPKSPMVRLSIFMGFELASIFAIYRSSIPESEWATRLVQTVGGVAPVVHHFDRAATYPNATAFVLAISPFLLIPKIVFWYQWLLSDRSRIYRYLIISPNTLAVPKNAMDFVSDPLRSDAENQSKTGMQPVSRFRAIAISLGTLVLVLVLGVFWPWFVYGTNVAKGRPADPRELAVAAGGWDLWWSWSLMQMNLAAICFAVGYCIVVEYFRFFKSYLNVKREA